MPRKAKKKGIRHRAISRIDTDEKRIHGWYVRVYLHGKVYKSKLFSDKKCGSKLKALELAIRFRNDAESERDNIAIPIEGKRIRTEKNANNTSGILGVSRVENKRANGKVDVYFQVNWSPEPNKPHNKRFSVLKHGEDEALRLAVEFRKTKERENARKMDNDNTFVDPEFQDNLKPPTPTLRFDSDVPSFEEDDDGPVYI